LKICVICAGFSYIFGGVETVVHKLSEQWAKQGHKVYILSGLGRKSAPSWVKLIKIPFIPTKYFQKIPLIKKIFPASEFEALSLLPFVLLCLLTMNPDIVLSNQLAETLPALILKIPCVMISHEPRRKFILGNFGVYTDVENPCEYSRSLLHAVSNKIDVTSPEYLQHMQKFDWKQIAQHYIEVFNNVLKKASSKHE
jgi:glycosyltransferase involved in cell wall biosynthesis